MPCRAPTAFPAFTDCPGNGTRRAAHCLGFEDIRPVAPVHVLLILLEHLSTLDAMEEEDRAVVGHLHLLAGRPLGWPPG